MWKGVTVGAMALSLSGCFIIPPAKSPMHEIVAQPGRHSDTLLVMLPGRSDRANDFVKRGFFTLAQGHGFDMVAADAHVGYYYTRNIVPRLDQDIIVPARTKGYKHIWLLGISLGGLGAILYTEQHPRAIDGMILLAPYTGDAGLLEEIKSTGLAHWTGQTDKGEAYQRKLWLWLKRATRTPNQPQIVLGYGTDDRFATVGDILGPYLPQNHQFTTAGGHNWKVWQALWKKILTAGVPLTDAGKQPREGALPTLSH